MRRGPSASAGAMGVAFSALRNPSASTERAKRVRVTEMVGTSGTAAFRAQAKSDIATRAAMRSLVLISIHGSQARAARLRTSRTSVERHPVALAKPLQHLDGVATAAAE